MYLGSLSKVSLKRDILWRILGGWDAFNLFCHPEYTFSHSNSPRVPRGRGGEGGGGGGGKFIQGSRSERGGLRARPRYPGVEDEFKIAVLRSQGRLTPIPPGYDTVGVK